LREKGFGNIENGEKVKRFFPKKTNFDPITEKEIRFMENCINNRPIKVLDSKTPSEAYLEFIVPLVS